MGVEDLVVAGSHGFDIWSPESGSIEREEGAAFEDLLERVTDTLREETALRERRSRRAEEELGRGPLPARRRARAGDGSRQSSMMCSPPIRTI